MIKIPLRLYYLHPTYYKILSKVQPTMVTEVQITVTDTHKEKRENNPWSDFCGVRLPLCCTSGWIITCWHPMSRHRSNIPQGTYKI